MKHKVFQQKLISFFLIGFCAIWALGIIGCGVDEDEASKYRFTLSA